MQIWADLINPCIYFKFWKMGAVSLSKYFEVSLSLRGHP